MQKDKRRQYRLPVEAPCVLKIIPEGASSQTAVPFKGMLKDVSVGGLLVNTDTLREEGVSIFPEADKPGVPKPKPRTLLIKFSLPDEREPFVAHVEPRWYDQADLSDPYEYQIGGRIIRIGKGDMARLQKYVRAHGQQEDLQEYKRRYKMSPPGIDTVEEVGKGKRSKFFDAVLPLQYRIICAKDRKRTSPFRTTTQQISLSGVNAEVTTLNVDGVDMVFDDTPMKRNALEMELSIPGQAHPVSATGEVHWLERFPSKDSYKYYVGIKFLKISSKDLGVIAQHIKGKPEAKDMAKKAR
jgi:hypothetical protein